ARPAWAANRWGGHALSPEDPLALTTPADALFVRSQRSGPMVRLRALRPLEALEANVLVSGCDPGLSVLAGRGQRPPPGQRPRWIPPPRAAGRATPARRPPPRRG